MANNLFEKWGDDKSDRSMSCRKQNEELDNCWIFIRSFGSHRIPGRITFQTLALELGEIIIKHELTGNCQTSGIYTLQIQYIIRSLIRCTLGIRMGQIHGHWRPSLLEPVDCYLLLIFLIEASSDQHVED